MLASRSPASGLRAHRLHGVASRRENRASERKKSDEQEEGVSDGDEAGSSGQQAEKKARWVVDGRFYTSSGISAGMDMALGFIADRYGEEEAQRIAGFTEYRRIADPSDDPFAI